MTRLLFVTAEAFPGHEVRNFQLVGELIARGYKVRHAGPAAVLADDRYAVTGFPESYRGKGTTRAAGLELFESWTALRSMVDWCDVLIVTNGKNYNETVQYAKSMGRAVLQVRDLSNHDPWVWKPDMIAVRNEWDRQITMSYGGMRDCDIVVTGTTIYDEIHHRRLSREAFCGKYGLDASKRIAVFLPESPANHSLAYRRYYGRICETIRAEADHELIIKPHPREYAKKKQAHRYETLDIPTWEQNAPRTPACEPQDKYDCLRHADVAVSRISTTYYEVALLGKPMIFVDLPEFFLDRAGLDHDLLKVQKPGGRFDRCGSHPYSPLGKLWDQVEDLTDPELRRTFQQLKQHYEKVNFSILPEYFGGECTIEELPDILRANRYADFDPLALEEYLKRYCPVTPGRAYAHVADFCDLALARKGIKRKVISARLKRATAYLLTQVSKLYSIGQRTYARP